MSPETLTPNQPEKQSNEERMFRSLTNILRSKAKAIAFQNGMTDLLSSINATEVIPDNQLPAYEETTKLHAVQFADKFGIPREELEETMFKLGLKSQESS